LAQNDAPSFSVPDNATTAEEDYYAGHIVVLLGYGGIWWSLEASGWVLKAMEEDLIYLPCREVWGLRF